MRLSTRLILLILGCMLPILGAQIYTQVHLHQERQRHIGRIALREAEFANRDLDGFVDDVAEIAATVSQFPEVPNAGPGCGDRMATLQRSLTRYRFLAVADSTGRVLCSSLPAMVEANRDQPTWLRDLLAAPDSRIGRLSTTPGLDGPFLPIAVRLPMSSSGAGLDRYLVTGLDLRWLAQHLSANSQDEDGLLAKGMLTLVDQDGVIVGRYPNGEQWIGRSLPESLRPLMNASSPGIRRATGPGGQLWLTA